MKTLNRLYFSEPRTIKQICEQSGENHFVICNALARAVGRNTETKSPELFRWSGPVPQFCIYPQTEKSAPADNASGLHVPTTQVYRQTLTPREAAEEARVSYTLIKEWMDQGLVELLRKPSGRIVIYFDSLVRQIRENKSSATRLSVKEKSSPESDDLDGL